jgi:hypothetical protein
MAHEQCARVIPETWLDEVGGEKVVFGVDSIVKDRWHLVRETSRDTFFLKKASLIHLLSLEMFDVSKACA